MLVHLGSNGKSGSKGGHFSDEGKSLVIINSLFLSKTLGNKDSFGLSILPSSLYFILNSHLQPIIFLFLGASTISQVSFFF
jgi:hypothetical protein